MDVSPDEEFRQGLYRVGVIVLQRRRFNRQKETQRCDFDHRLRLTRVSADVRWPIRLCAQSYDVLAFTSVSGTKNATVTFPVCKRVRACTAIVSKRNSTETTAKNVESTSKIKGF